MSPPPALCCLPPGLQKWEGGLSSRSWASPIRFQVGLVLDRYLSRALELVCVIGHHLNYCVGSYELRL